MDGKELYLLAFNYTHLDMALSRSFAAVIKDPEIVHEAQRLFECDVKRVPYLSENDQLVVSPINARQRLKAFVLGAKKQLLIYEMKLSDPEFIRILNDKVTEGVEVRVISRAPIKNAALPVRIASMRLHVRGMIRDGHDAFLGSMSLRRLELGARREVGVLFHDAKSVKQLMGVFEQDWASASPAIPNDLLAAALEAPAKRVAKVVARQMSVKPVVEELLDKMMDTAKDMNFEPEQVAQTVRDAFREEVHDAVMVAMREVVMGTPASDATAPEGETKKHARPDRSAAERKRRFWYGTPETLVGLPTTQQVEVRHALRPGVFPNSMEEKRTGTPGREMYVDPDEIKVKVAFGTHGRVGQGIQDPQCLVFLVLFG